MGQRLPDVEYYNNDNRGYRFYGLCLVGFGDKRQNVRPGLLHNRFLAFFGPDPKSVKDLLNDLKEEFDDTSFKDTMMTLNWAKRYDVEHVLAGRWGYSEEYIGPKLKEIGKRIQSFVSKVIVFDPNLFDEREIHIITVDTFNCTTEEMRQTPSTAFYDHKSNSCGLKYEAALPIRHRYPVSLKGPFKAGEKHDRTVFCGGNKDTAASDRDKSSLFFKIPVDKKAVGDSAYEGMPEKVLVRREGHSKETTDFINAALARQENYHSRLKSYDILRCRFRHGKSTENKMVLHKMATEMVAVIVQYDLRYRPLCETDNYI